MPKLFLELKLVDEHGKVHGVVRRQISDHVAYLGPRTAERLRNPVSFAGETFEDAVQVLKARELRKHTLRGVTPMLGDQLADFLYDREGWSDPSRQEATEKIARDASTL